MNQNKEADLAILATALRDQNKKVEAAEFDVYEAQAILENEKDALRDLITTFYIEMHPPRRFK